MSKNKSEADLFNNSVYKPVTSFSRSCRNGCVIAKQGSVCFMLS